MKQATGEKLGNTKYRKGPQRTTKDHTGPHRTAKDFRKDRKGPQSIVVIVVEPQRTYRKTAQDHKGPQGHLIRHHCCITRGVTKNCSGCSDCSGAQLGISSPFPFLFSFLFFLSAFILFLLYLWSILVFSLLAAAIGLLSPFFRLPG